MTRLRRRITAGAATGALAAALALGGLAPGPLAPTPAGADVASDRCYVASMHRAFLDRSATPYELEMWTARLVATSPRPAVPRALAASDEWLRTVVHGTFITALDREPDPSGLAFWVDRLRSGTRLVTLTAQIYGSDELWTKSGSTPEGFVAHTFERIMGREASAGDVTYWAEEVGRRGRGGVAKALLGSIESRRSRVTALYVLVLDRQPDVTGRDYWAGRLTAIDDVQLAVHLGSSPEAYQRAQVGCVVPPAPTTTVLTDGDRSSLTPDISDDGRYVAFLSAAQLLPGGRDDLTRDLYLLDRTTGVLTRAVEADAHLRAISISGDGRHVVFLTAATDLVPSDGTAPVDVYSWDRTTGTVTRVTDGDQDEHDPAGHTTEATVSADGRFVAFGTSAQQLPEEPDGFDGFVWDRTTGGIERLEDAGVGSTPIITRDGSTVLYASIDPVAPDDRPEAEDVFAWDRATGALSFVGPGLPIDAAADGDVVAFDDRGVLTLIDAQTGAVTPISTYADSVAGGVDIAADGASVVFVAGGTDRFPGDTRYTPDIYVWERATGAVAWISPRGNVSGGPATSADGRLVVFASGPAPPAAPHTQVTLWDRGS